MKLDRLVALLVLPICAGCHAPTFEQKAGTEFQSTDKGMRATTYVSQEEYDKMTPEERNRLHAAVGVSATVAQWGNGQAKPRELSAAELDQALKGPK